MYVSVASAHQGVHLNTGICNWMILQQSIKHCELSARRAGGARSSGRFRRPFFSFRMFKLHFLTYSVMVFITLGWLWKTKADTVLDTYWQKNPLFLFKQIWLNKFLAWILFWWGKINDTFNYYVGLSMCTYAVYWGQWLVPKCYNVVEWIYSAYKECATL